LNVSPGADPNRVADDTTVAVWLTRMVDKPGEITAHYCIPSPSTVNPETPDVTFLQVFALARLTFLNRDLFTSIINDSLVLIDGFSGKDTPSVQLRTPLTYR
jgi:hypothetical protein